MPAAGETDRGSELPSEGWALLPSRLRAFGVGLQGWGPSAARGQRSLCSCP